MHSECIRGAYSVHSQGKRPKDPEFQLHPSERFPFYTIESTCTNSRSKFCVLLLDTPEIGSLSPSKITLQIEHETIKNQQICLLLEPNVSLEDSDETNRAFR